MDLVDLEVGGGGSILPAAQALDDGGAAQRTRPLTVEPDAQAVLTEHMLADENQGIPEVLVADGAEVPRLTTLLGAGPDPHALLSAAEDDQRLAKGGQPAAEVKGLAEAVDDDERGSQQVAGGRFISHDVLIPQLDGQQRPKQLAELLQQQVQLPPGLEGQEDAGQTQNQALQADGAELEDEVCDAHSPYQVEEIHAVDVGFSEHQENMKWKKQERSVL